MIHRAWCSILPPGHSPEPCEDLNARCDCECHARDDDDPHWFIEERRAESKSERV